MPVNVEVGVKVSLLASASAMTWPAVTATPFRARVPLAAGGKVWIVNEASVGPPDAVPVRAGMVVAAALFDSAGAVTLFTSRFFVQVPKYTSSKPKSLPFATRFTSRTSNEAVVLLPENHTSDSFTKLVVPSRVVTTDVDSPLITNPSCAGLAGFTLLAYTEKV